MAFHPKVSHLTARIALAGLVSSVAFFPSRQAVAQAVPVPSPYTIFSKENFESLCLKTTPRLVSRYALAELVVHELSIPLDLLKAANPNGKPSGGSADTPVPPSNYIYVLTSSTPFGENSSPPADMQEQAKRKLAAKKIDTMRGVLQTWLQAGGSENYRIQSSRPGPVYFNEFFSENSPIEIVCVEKKKKPGEPPQVAQAPAPKNWGANIIVRKAVKDIPIPADKIEKANAAIFSYTQNNEDDSRSYTIDGLIGVTIAGTGADSAERAAAARKYGTLQPYYWAKLTPYVYGKRYNRTPDSPSNKDIDLVQPGIVGSLTWVSASGGFAFDLLGDASHTNDIAQDASIYNAALTFSPSIQIGNTILFNAPLFFGPIGMRPNVGFILRDFYIEDAGISPQFQDKTSFLSYGADMQLKFFLITKLKYLAALEARLRYLYLENTNGVVNIPRFEAGLSFSPAGLTNVTLDLEYVDGRDENTLQDENRWTAGVGVRF
jgi:hypothetical protein